MAVGEELHVVLAAEKRTLCGCDCWEGGRVLLLLLGRWKGVVVTVLY